MIVKENRHEKNGIPMPVDCLMMEKTIDTPDTYAHYHSYIELLYLIDGDVNIWLNDALYEFHAGEIVVINSNETHRLISLTQISHYVVVKFLPSVIYDTQQSLLEFKYILPFIVNNCDHPRILPASYVSEFNLERLMLHTVEETEHEKTGWEIAVRADVLNIFIFVIRFWEQEGVNLSLPQADNDLIKAIQVAMDYVSENIADVSEKDIAERCGLSYSYFSRSFKRIMRMSFTEYVNHMRVSNAQKLLITTDKSITEIADDLGFSSSSHFIQTFKKFKNCSPKKFRTRFSSDTQE